MTLNQKSGVTALYVKDIFDTFALLASTPQIFLNSLHSATLAEKFGGTASRFDIFKFQMPEKLISLIMSMKGVPRGSEMKQSGIEDTGARGAPRHHQIKNNIQFYTENTLRRKASRVCYLV